MLKKTAFYALALSTGVFVLGGLAPAGAKVSIDAVPGRLPKTVAPVRYDISIVPDMTAMRIHGNETISLDVIKPTNTIVLNALQTTVSKAALDGAAVSSIKTSPQLLTLTFARPIAPGAHKLALAYTATLQTTAQGLFVQKYTDENGKTAQMLGTQFESTDARRMFPSFDEPVFRAKYRLTVTVPKAWTAVSNMPIARSVDAGSDSKRVTFGTTVSMPTYLLAFAAGDFDRVSGSAGSTQINVYGTKGKGPELTYARDSLERLVPYFERYYGIKFPLPKLDLVAIPGFFGGAMENWGAMFFTESTVVYDPALQSSDAKRGVFDIIAHETSHQWNGDLVTMAWWDSLWLNEGFATWMETKSTAENNPSWNWWLRFDASTNGSLIADAKKNTTKIQVPVHNETEANTVFDPEIAYQKAGAFIRMIEAYLGPQTFRQGLHRYFAANEYENSVPNDLWSALSAVSHQNVAAIADSWINQPGFPLVTVTSTCEDGRRTLHLSQQRYTSFSGGGSSTIWDIPLTIETGTGKTTPFLFSARTATLAGGSCERPLIVNGDDLGYYRVAYDQADQTLQQRYFKNLTVADRISLLDDSWQFATDGKAKLGEFLSYVHADSGDTEPHAVGSILDHLAAMEQYEYGKPGEAAFKAYAVSYLKPLLAKLGGWDGPTNDSEVTNLRVRVLGSLSSAGDKETIAEAQKRFAAFLQDPNSLKEPMKSAVLQIAGRYADEATYDQLLKLGMTARNPIEMQAYLVSAFIAKDPALAQRSLDMSLQLPPQFASFAPFIVLSVGQDHPEMAWSFLQKNDAKLFGSLSEFDKIPYVSIVAQNFWRGVPADQIQAFLKANIPPAGAKEIDKAMESVHLAQAQRARLLPQIDAYVQSQGAASAAAP